MLAGAGSDRLANVVLVTDGQITGEDHAADAGARGSGEPGCIASASTRRSTPASWNASPAGQRPRPSWSNRRSAWTRRWPGWPGPSDAGADRVRVSAEGVDPSTDSVTPNRFPDAFAGVPCVISGRYRGRPRARPTPRCFHVQAAGSSGHSSTLPARSRRPPPPCRRSGRARWSVTWRTSTRPAPDEELSQRWSRTRCGSGCCAVHRVRGRRPGTHRRRPAARGHAARRDAVGLGNCGLAPPRRRCRRPLARAAARSGRRQARES